MIRATLIGLGVPIPNATHLSVSFRGNAGWGASGIDIGPVPSSSQVELDGSEDLI